MGKIASNQDNPFKNCLHQPVKLSNFQEYYSEYHTVNNINIICILTEYWLCMNLYIFGYLSQTAILKSNYAENVEKI